MKTLKTAELPHTIYITFKGDNEIYDSEIVEIADIDEKNDRCALIADNLMPQRCRLAMPYSALDNPVIDFGNGAKIYVDHP